MLMFLTILLAGFAVTAVCAVMVAGISPRAAEAPAFQPAKALAAEPPRFFAGEVEPAATRQPIPLEVLLGQIERHVRVEQAAARSFLAGPTPDSLHSRTESPFVN